MPDHKRRLYYEKATGKIIHDIGEMHGDVPPQLPIEEEIKTLSFPNHTLDEIDCVELEPGEYEDPFGREFRCVNPRCKKLRFYNNEAVNYQKFYYNEQTVKEKYTVEEVYRFYNEHYINFNLKQLVLGVPNFSLKWYSLDELNIRTTILNRSWYYYFKDGFLSDSATNKTKLAKDILEHGTYWPLKVARDPNDGLLYVYEGNHRVISAKLLQLEGSWDNNRKWLCIEFEGDYLKYKHTSDKRNHPEILLPEVVRQRIPFVVKYGSEASKEDKNILYSMDAENSFFVDKHTIEIETESYHELISAGETYPHWLRDIIYNFRNDYGIIIKPSPIINNEEVWKVWKERMLNEAENNIL